MARGVPTFRPDAGNGERRLERIARRTRSGAYGWGWALHLVVLLINEDDTWTPVVALSDAILKLEKR